MYCPQCSQEQVSDQVRFCSRCGFQLNVVKELLAAGSVPTQQIGVPDARNLPRQRDVNIGTTLMFVGAALAMASSRIISSGPPTVVIGATLLVLSLVLINVLVLSRPLLLLLHKLLPAETEGGNVSPRRSDANRGAIAMYIVMLVSTFVAMFLGADIRIPMFLISVISFVLTLALTNVFPKTFHRLFAEDALAVDRFSLVTRTTLDAAALPPGHDIPIPSSRVNTAEMVQPPSITEHTTTLLDRPERRLNSSDFTTTAPGP